MHMQCAHNAFEMTSHFILFYHTKSLQVLPSHWRWRTEETPDPTMPFRQGHDYTGEVCTPSEYTSLHQTTQEHIGSDLDTMFSSLSEKLTNTQT